MKKIIISIFIVFLCTTFLSTNVVADTKEIKVVIDDNYPPFSFRGSNNELIGISIDYWELFEEKTGIKIEIVGTNWADAQKMMKNGEFDVIDTIFKSDVREKIYDFTNSYATIETSIYFNNKISGIVDIDSTKGFGIASKEGGYSVRVLKEHGIENVILYSNYEDIIKAAIDGKIVMFIMDKPSADYFLHKYGGQDQFNYTKPVYVNFFYRAVAEGNKELINILNIGFDKISQSEINEINKNWYGSVSGESEINLAAIRNTIVIFFAIIFILIFANLFLKGQVKKTTKEINKASDELDELNQYLRAILNSIPNLIFVLDNEGTFLDNHIEDREGYAVRKNEFMGKTFEDIFPEEIAIGFRDEFDKFFETNISKPYAYRLLEYGDRSYYEVTFNKINDERIIAIVQNITKHKKAQKTIYQLGIKDILTDSYNRNYFEKYIGDIDSKKDYYGVLICDIDSLKFINDTLGHSAGDDYLKKVAKILKSNISTGSMVARIGGDEFCAIIYNTTADKLEKLKQNIKNAISKNDENYSFMEDKLSIGYSLKQNDNEIFKDLMQVADQEMYREKLQHKHSRKSGNVSLLLGFLKLRNFETADHVERLEEYCKMIAEELEFNESKMNEILLFAKFHDIGKIAVNDNILLKPGKLTKDEYEEMKKHSDAGFKIAKSLTDIEHIADYIYKHHEWYNGEGYPFGLKGNDIPLECRILSVADAYDAMTNDRPYRKAMSQDEAIEELMKFKGIQFDPKIVDIFIEKVLKI